MKAHTLITNKFITCTKKIQCSSTSSAKQCKNVGNQIKKLDVIAE